MSIDDLHWKCPNCGDGCRCTDAFARAAPHVPCGKPTSAGPGWRYIDEPATAIEKGYIGPPVPEPLRSHDTMGGE